MRTAARRVIKLGGSLLELPGLVTRLRAWLAAQLPAENLLVVGGGQAADAVRAADRLHGLDQTAAHWLCIRAMALNAELIAALLPEAGMLGSVCDLPDMAASRQLWIVEPWRFMHDDEPRLSPIPLPATWDVTSDSIAARLAAIVSANELVLLKSALPVPPYTIEAAVSSGYVDACFPKAAKDVKRIRCVNLRDPEMPSVALHSDAW